MQLELSEPERDELEKLVSAAYADLNPEIHRAMDSRYRESLRQRRALLESVLARLAPATADTGQ